MGSDNKCMLLLKNNNMATPEEVIESENLLHVIPLKTDILYSKQNKKTCISTTERHIVQTM